MTKTERFIQVILENSLNKDLFHAKNEWQLQSLKYNEYYSGECICGQCNIAKIAIIHNFNTNIKLEIGANCANSILGYRIDDSFFKKAFSKAKLKASGIIDLLREEDIDRGYAKKIFNDWEKHFLYSMNHTSSFSKKQIKVLVKIYTRLNIINKQIYNH